MTGAEAAARHAFRADFQLIAYTDVGLPYWRIRARCELLARKQISPIDEHLLRAIKTGVNHRPDLQLMLGLDETVLDTTIGTMLAQDTVRLTAKERVTLTDKGSALEASALEERSEERMVAFDFDGLLRRPVLLDQPLEPSQLAALGAREIPPHPPRRPDEFEAREHKNEIEQLIRSYGSRRDREVDLLAIKEVVRRERIYRHTTALLFRANHGNELRLAFVADDELDQAHENAFAQAQLLERVGLARGVRSRTRHPALLDEHVLVQHDPDTETAIREQIRQRQMEFEASGDPEGEAAGALRDARRELAKLPVRILECYEHPSLIDVSLRSARAELTIITPRITDAVVHNDMVGEIRRALHRDIRIRLGYGTSSDPDDGIGEAARARLASLGADYANLELAHLGDVKHNVLIRDRAWAAHTNYPLLAHRGDAARALGDERGWLLAGPKLTAPVRAAWDKHWQSHAQPHELPALLQRESAPAPARLRPRRGKRG